MSLREVIDSRVLGAFRLIDSPTRAVIRRPLNVSAPAAVVRRNRSYDYVFWKASRLEHHTQAFSVPPASPPLGDVDVDIEVHDVMHRYLPRAATISLPRNANPDQADQQDSLFQAVPIQMYAAPGFPMHPNWSGIRATLAIAAEPATPLPGALLRVVRISDDVVLARGYSDRRGETLVAIPGIPITNFATRGSDDDFDASEPVVISETSVRVEVIVDESLPWPIDPDVLEANRSDWLREGVEPLLLTLRTGQIVTIRIEVDLS